MKKHSDMLKSLTVLLIWLAAAGAGLAWLQHYSLAAGERGEAPREWPPGIGAHGVAESFTLLMFMHPECPCSRASLEELGVLLARCSGRVKAQVLFLRPEGGSGFQSDTALWRQAQALPGVEVKADPGGGTAEHFPARTSGETCVYDRCGRLVFHGGITAARGHCGDNAGLDAIESLTKEGGAAADAPVFTAVYGCPLQEEPAAAPGGSSNSTGNDDGRQ